jgi:transposase InsO family protein
VPAGRGNDRVHPDEGAATVAGFTQRALAFYAGLGVTVQRVLTDNGNGYRSGVFRQVVTGAGVAHKRTRPCRPQSNGKAERLNLTLDREWCRSAESMTQRPSYRTG